MLGVVVVLLVCVGAAILFLLAQVHPCPPSPRVAQAQMNSFKTALIAYKLTYKRFPESLEGLVDNPKGVSFLDPPAIPLDPWGNPYIYSLSGIVYEIVSYGEDGKPGGTGYGADVSSAKLTEEGQASSKRGNAAVPDSIDQERTQQYSQGG